MPDDATLGAIAHELLAEAERADPTWAAPPTDVLRGRDAAEEAGDTAGLAGTAAQAASAAPDTSGAPTGAVPSGSAWPTEAPGPPGTPGPMPPSSTSTPDALFPGGPAAPALGPSADPALRLALEGLGRAEGAGAAPGGVPLPPPGEPPTTLPAAATAPTSASPPTDGLPPAPPASTAGAPALPADPWATLMGLGGHPGASAAPGAMPPAPAAPTEMPTAPPTALPAELPTDEAALGRLLAEAGGLALGPTLARTRAEAPAGGPEAATPQARVPALASAPAHRPRQPGAGVRDDFPILHQTVHGRPLIWMDNAATTQKPRAVIDAMARFYERNYSNIHRGAHTLAARATEAYEDAREKVRRFLGAGSAEEIVWVRGTTEAINLVAQAWGRREIGPGDEILLTQLEHHANIVPWQMLAKETGARIRVAPVDDTGQIVLDAYATLIGPRTRLVGVTHVSNALGTVLPVEEMVALAHRRGIPVLVDGAQSVPHTRVDVQAIGADFYVFSGHKVYGPSGVGCLWARRDILESMPPWQGGGNMIRAVTFEHTTYAEPPAKFEAGTPTIADAVGLGAAIDYVDRIGIDAVSAYEHELTEYAMARLATVPGLRLIGTAPGKVSVLSFVVPGTRPEDVGRYLDGEGIAVRAGHHCAMPTMERFGVTGTVRPSLAIYNTREEVDCLVDAMRRFRPSGSAS